MNEAIALARRPSHAGRSLPAACLLLFGACAADAGAPAGETPEPAVAVSGPAASSQPVAGSWPQFRGPAADGIVTGETLTVPWPEGGPPQIWRTTVGAGYSGMTVVDNRLFTLFDQSGSEWLAAYDAATGAELWRHRQGGAYRDSQGDGPRSTPSVADGVVYALGAQGELAALRAADGELVWRHALARDFGARIPTWGASTQPVVEADLLLVNVGGRGGRSAMAFDRATGEVRWSVGDDGAGYSMPQVFDVVNDGKTRRQAVFLTAASLLAVDPKTGQELWSQPWSTSYDVNAASPIFVPPNRLFVSTGYDTGAALFEIVSRGAAFEARELWRSRGLKNKFSSSVIVGDRIYGFDNSILKAVDLKTGEDVWRQRGFGHGTLLYADGHFIVLGENCKLALVKTDPDAYREVSSVQVLGRKCWTMPTLVDGRLFLRDQETMESLRVGPGSAGSGG
ncbi:MAG: PQQ-binding-like beta-propeller repeat protein [Acidobacteria bacterium]|nr:PQQ-binding-like beta-propeller repeat protein [Acidobacteriota bacterium]